MKIWEIRHVVCEGGERSRYFNKKPSYELFLSVLEEWDAYPHHNSGRMKTWEKTYKDTGEVNMGDCEFAYAKEIEIIAIE